MEVRFSITLHLHRRLIRLAAYPDQKMWAQSTLLYVGGDMDAYSARYLAPVTPIVSPRQHIYLSAHSINFPSQTFKFIPGGTR